MNATQKLEKLRSWMASQGAAAFILPMADEFLSEYVPPHAMRITWLSGFDGSAGTLVITANEAALFTDGRYIIQAHQQLDTNFYQVLNISQHKMLAWVKEKVGDAEVMYDPMLHSASWLKQAEKQGLTLAALSHNPMDAWWEERPQAPLNHAWVYPDEVAGQASKEKITLIAAALTALGADAMLISMAESIAWLLNIRGGDLACTPIMQAYALLHKDGKVQLCCEKRKITKDVAEHISHVEILPLEEIATRLAALDGKKLLVNESSTPAALTLQASAFGAEIMTADDPIEHAKAVKNDRELMHIQEAHVKDGAALVKALMTLDVWLELDEIVDELRVDALLAAKRSEMDGFISLSFPAIVGVGEHGAIVHYRVTEASNKQLENGQLLLIDSGGQYLGGTTDVTRTLVIGGPDAQQKHHYTLVLKGHLALARAVFPVGTPGSHLDALARQFLWAEKLDYDHGTGHGVGACLNVHEGPQRISKRAADKVALQPGMILSNEPGYYAEGKYGIRIENLVEVIEVGQGYLGFENLTLVPYARALIDTAMLSAQEIEQINAYHARVEQTLAPFLDAKETAWLNAACAPL